MGTGQQLQHKFHTSVTKMTKWYGLPTFLHYKYELLPSADQRTGFVIKCTTLTKAICLMKSHCAVLLQRASGSFLSSYEY